MATVNKAAAEDMVAPYAAASLQIREGSTVLVTHTLTGFGELVGSTITANAVADAEIANSTTTGANNAKLIADGKALTLTVGTSGAEVNMSSLTLVAKGNSVISSIVLTFPVTP